jgi:hypothetical protein
MHPRLSLTPVVHRPATPAIVTHNALAFVTKTATPVASNTGYLVEGAAQRKPMIGAFDTLIDRSLDKQIL